MTRTQEHDAKGHFTPTGTHRKDAPVKDPTRELCGAKKRKGTGTCQRPAGSGTDHKGVGTCRVHAGSTPGSKKYASRELARRACVALGIPIETTAADALLNAVNETNGNVAFYREELAKLQVHPNPDEWVTDGDGNDGHWVPGKVGLYTTDHRSHALVTHYERERDRLIHVAGEVLKAGVDERRTRIAESDASMLMGLYDAVFAKMGLSDRSEEFKRELAGELRGPGQSSSLGAADGA